VAASHDSGRLAFTLRELQELTMEVPGSPQDVTEELLSELDLKGLLDLYAKGGRVGRQIARRMRPVTGV
jgi:hypothetical protein